MDTTPLIKESYSIHNPDGKVRYLIYHHTDATNGEIMVFVDKDLDLDWECDDKAGELLDVMPLKASVRKIQNGIASLEPLAHNWPDDLKLTSKRLLGEAIASVLLGDVAGAEKALKSATIFFQAKSRQVSRFWTLQACLVTGGIATIMGLVELVERSAICTGIGRTPYLISLCFWAGCVGALLFVVMRFGKQPIADSTAERHLHYLEALARIVGGGIAGVLAGAMVKLGFILPIFEKSGLECLGMCAAAMIAGASERLAAGIITKVENSETTKQEKHNGDN
jgi:hypothetical protein